MKTSVTFKVIACTAALACSLTACSKDDADSSAASASTSTSAAAAATTTDEVVLPTAAELNEVLQRAIDPAVPVEEKVLTVQDGQTAPDLFDTMARSKDESGAQFQVVDPILEGYDANSVLASVAYSLPDRPAQTTPNVEFVFEDGRWKLSRTWACNLITNTVSPEEVPAMCQAEGAPVVAADEAVPPAADAPAEGAQ